MDNKDKLAIVQRVYNEMQSKSPSEQLQAVDKMLYFKLGWEAAQKQKTA